MSVPKLRFKDFKGEWKVKKLEELLLFKNGINATKEQYGKGVKFINVMDIINNDFITHDNIIGCVDITEKIFEESKVEYGDVLFQRSYETREEVGQASVYLDKNKSATFCSFVIRGKKIGEYNPIFMNFLLKTHLIRKDITDKSAGSTIYNIGKDTLKTVAIHLPSIPEQTKIADFLITIDEKIAQLTQKCELLARYKKGLIQKIFSQQLRFKDDDGRDFPAWEEKTLKDIFTIKYGKDYKHLNSGNIPVIGTGGVITYVDQFLYDKPSVLIGRKGTIDKPEFIKKPFWTVDTLFYTEINKGFVPFFVYLLVLQINWYKFNEATGVPSLNTTAINNVEVLVPLSFQEQIKIADFLTALDEKTTQSQTYLETVKQYKQGLIQQMFI